MALANVYRPMTFEDVIGQEHITDILKAKIESEKTSHHNYLMFGPRGTGKTTCARLLSRSLNCLDLQNGSPCNKCTNCETIISWTTLDYIEIDAASHTWVDNIREEILDKVPYPPIHLKKKIYVIDEVHMLSKGAFNALLKTIEEPRDNVCFIFATTEIHKIPDTIISRCQVFNFKKVSIQNIIKRLKYICEQEKITFTEEALALIAKISEWCPRDAIKYVDQINVLGDITEAHVTKFLGVAPDALIADFLAVLKMWIRENAFEQIDMFHAQGIDLLQFAKQVLMYLDEHLIEDVDFYLRVSDVFTKILGNIKYYPYPSIVYKIALNTLFGGEVTVSSDEVIIKKKTMVKEVLASKKPSKSDEQRLSDSEVKTPAASGDGDLLQRLLAKIDKSSLKASLSEHIIIDRVENWIVYIVVINKMTDLILKKEDIVMYVEWLFSELLGEEVKMSMEFQKKDEYFASKLGI